MSSTRPLVRWLPTVLAFPLGGLLTIWAFGPGRLSVDKR